MKPRYKTSVICIILAICWIGQASAQVNIGFKSGVHIAFNNLTFEHGFSQVTNRDNITSLSLAIPFEIPSESMFAFRSGVELLSKGTRISFSDALREEHFINKYEIDYLQIPLLAKVTLPFNAFNLYLIGGTNVAYAIDLELLQLTYKTNGNYENENRKLDFNKAQISRLDVSLAYGGGIEAKISQGKKLFVDLRFNLGLNDIDKRSQTEVYNQGRSITMGILVPVRSRKKLQSQNQAATKK